jgi:hypothetical protein
MPPDDRLGLDDHECLLPVAPDARQEDPKAAISVLWPRFLCTSLQYMELVTKGERSPLSSGSPRTFQLGPGNETRPIVLL